MLEEARCKREFFAVTSAYTLETGGPIDVARSEENYLKAQSVLTKKIDQFDRQEKRFGKN